jgi:hypothetical protein
MRGQTLISNIARIARREIDRKTQCRFSSAMASIWKSGEYDPNCEPLIVSANPGSTLYRNVPARFRSAGCNIEKLGHALARRVVARRVTVARQKCPPSLKLRRDSLHSPLRRKTGGKGIRTPDFQLAKLALYQLSYAPGEFSILDCGARIANGREAMSRASAVSANAEAGCRSCESASGARRFFERAKLRSCAEKAALFSFPIVPREVPPNTLFSHQYLDQ